MITREIKAVFDPITRLEGHLKIEITIDKVNGSQQVVDAKSTGSLFRGFENILIGRDPRDAQHITQRICGVCPVAHGMAAVKALDLAYDCTDNIPTNARIMRNLVNGSNFVESHILHFFLLSVPDFIEGPAMAPWQVDWEVDRRFSKSENDLLMSHYIQALEMRRKADQMSAIFGGRLPHPNAFIPGGFTCTPRQERIDLFNAFLDELIPFVQNVYIKDVEFLAAKYPDYLNIGQGYGNLLAYGAFDQDASGNQLLAQGQIQKGSTTVQPLDIASITEHVGYSWFKDHSPANPATGKTEAQKPKGDAYSWLKSPRYNDKPYEVGPLARMWVNGDYQRGVSTMDRHLARAQEALKIALAMKTWIAQLDASGPVYNEPNLTNIGTGIGLTEAPRGALGHWLEIGADHKIAHYQIITPTTWNVGPRDNNGLLGPLEQSLLGTHIKNADEPIEVMRIIHSFDPCLDCASHIIRPGKETKVYRLGCC
ncbi:MAG: nickel-dependent hydrogenase large subunit [Phycisphaerae bacterium]|nr:nickel-dependent hydrogenase large subunit [Phycisphaerae bacterium]